ncbi:MAG: ABC transporter substrate-binding protein [Verrucomicrobiota bacterium]
MDKTRFVIPSILAAMAIFVTSCSEPPPPTPTAKEETTPTPESVVEKEAPETPTLKIGYSDWPGWVAWEIGIAKKWFEEEGVDVKFEWYDYVASMDAYVAGNVDAVCMTNGDALVTGATGKPSVGIIINDFSNGNDMIVAKPGIESIADLKGKKVGVEEGFVCHLLLLKGLESVGLSDADITIVNTPTNETPQVLASGAVDAIGAWQPNSGQALKTVAGSKPVFTSADAPGIIYDLLYVSPESLAAHKAEWMKVVKVWYRIVDYLKDESNTDDALKILSSRVNLPPEEYEPFLKGTYILTLDEALVRWQEAEGLGSIYGSSKIVDDFNVRFEVYKEPLDTTKYLDSSLTKSLK